MRFKIDENLPLVAKATILEVGHDCHSVYDEGIDGGSDAELIEACRREGRVLVTLDLDFADIIRYPPTDCAGIVILRLPGQSPPCICQKARGAARRHRAHGNEGASCHRGPHTDSIPLGKL